MSTNVRFEFLVYPSSNLKDEDETCFDIHTPLATKEDCTGSNREFEEYSMGNQIYIYGLWWTIFYLCTNSRTVRVKCNVLPNTDKRVLIRLVAEYGFTLDVSVAEKNGFAYLIYARDGVPVKRPDKVVEPASEFVPLTTLSDTPEVH